MYTVPPLLRFLCHRGHGRVATFPMTAGGHGLACSSHGFLQLGRAAVRLIKWGRIENADLLRVTLRHFLSCSPLLN